MLNVLRQLDGGVWGMMWDNIFSQCTWLGVTKNVFFNNFVINKSSGSVSYVQVSNQNLNYVFSVIKHQTKHRCTNGEEKLICLYYVYFHIMF